MKPVAKRSGLTQTTAGTRQMDASRVHVIALCPHSRCQKCNEGRREVSDLRKEKQ